jgi:hypothetical protein
MIPTIVVYGTHKEAISTEAHIHELKIVRDSSVFLSFYMTSRSRPSGTCKEWNVRENTRKASDNQNTPSIHESPQHA